jgi:hypothetical protein
MCVAPVRSGAPGKWAPVGGGNPDAHMCVLHQVGKGFPINSHQRAGSNISPNKPSYLLIDASKMEGRVRAELGR